MEGLPIQGTLKYTGHFSGPNRLRMENSDFLGDLSVDDVFRIVIVQKYFLDPFYFSIESTLGASH